MPPEWHRGPRPSSFNDFHVRDIGMDGDGHVRVRATGPATPVATKDINKPTPDWPRTMHGVQWSADANNVISAITPDGFALQVAPGPGRFDWFCVTREPGMFHEGRADTLKTAIYDAARSLYEMRNMREISGDVPPWP